MKKYLPVLFIVLSMPTMAEISRGSIRDIILSNVGNANSARASFTVSSGRPRCGIFSSGFRAESKEQMNTILTAKNTLRDVEIDYFCRGSSPSIRTITLISKRQ